MTIEQTSVRLMTGRKGTDRVGIEPMILGRMRTT